MQEIEKLIEEADKLLVSSRQLYKSMEILSRDIQQLKSQRIGG